MEEALGGQVNARAKSMFNGGQINSSIKKGVNNTRNTESFNMTRERSENTNRQAAKEKLKKKQTRKSVDFIDEQISDMEGDEEEEHSDQGGFEMLEIKDSRRSVNVVQFDFANRLSSCRKGVRGVSTHWSELQGFD